MKLLKNMEIFREMTAVSPSYTEELSNILMCIFPSLREMNPYLTSQHLVY